MHSFLFPAVIDFILLGIFSIVMSYCTWMKSAEIGSGDGVYIGSTIIRNAIPFIPYWNWGMDGAGFAWQAVFFSIVALTTSISESQIPIYISVFGFSPITLGALATYPLARYSIGNRFGALVACLLFGWNTHSLVGLHGGQFLQVAPITFMPVILYVAIRAIEAPQAMRLFDDAVEAICFSGACSAGAIRPAILIRHILGGRHYFSECKPEASEDCLAIRRYIDPTRCIDARGGSSCTGAVVSWNALEPKRKPSSRIVQ